MDWSEEVGIKGTEIVAGEVSVIVLVRDLTK
jgi:hypothetical protein